MEPGRKSMLCLPGLGGHASALAEYADLFPGYRLHFMELVNRRKALEEARQILRSEKAATVLFCNCYSAQMGIQLAQEMPDKVDSLVFLEPFFSEFQPWLQITRPLLWIVQGIVRFSAAIGIRRRKLAYQPDYVALSKYPIYIQPIFDMRWQNLTDYFDKCYDILTFKLPKRVETPTLMIFSPHGFSRDPKNKERLKGIFPKVRMVEMENGTHNVITMGARSIAAIVLEYLNTADRK